MDITLVTYLAKTYGVSTDDAVKIIKAWESLATISHSFTIDDLMKAIYNQPPKNNTL